METIRTYGLTSFEDLLKHPQFDQAGFMSILTECLSGTYEEHPFFVEDFGRRVYVDVRKWLEWERDMLGDDRPITEEAIKVYL